MQAGGTVNEVLGEDGKVVRKCLEAASGVILSHSGEKVSVAT